MGEKGAVGRITREDSLRALTFYSLANKMREAVGERAV